MNKLPGKQSPGEAKFRAFATQALLIYVSQLAQSVDIPPGQLNTTDLDFLQFTYPVPIGNKILPLKVKYLEDELNTVYNFHTYWKGTVIPSTITEKLSDRTFKLSDLSTVCLTGMYADTTTSTLLQGLEVPVGGTVYPQIFPVLVQRSTMDKAGNGLATVDVTYARIPKIRNWTAFKKLSDLVAPGPRTVKIGNTEYQGQGYSTQDINSVLRGI